MVRTRSVCTPLLAAAALAAPRITRAQASPLDPPVNYFAGPTRAWALSGCATGVVGLGPDRSAPAIGQAYCVEGRATLGAVAGGGYDLLLAFVQTSPPAVVAAGNTYSLSPTVSGIVFALGAGCPVGTPGCTASTALTGGPGYYRAEFFRSGYATLPGFDFGTFAVTSLEYATTTQVPSYPQIAGQYTTARLTATAVPEPAPLSLTAAALGATGALAAARRRRS